MNPGDRAAGCSDAQWVANRDRLIAPPMAKNAEKHLWHERLTCGNTGETPVPQTR